MPSVEYLAENGSKAIYEDMEINWIKRTVGVKGCSCVYNLEAQSLEDCTREQLNRYCLWLSIKVIFFGCLQVQACRVVQSVIAHWCH